MGDTALFLLAAAWVVSVMLAWWTGYWSGKSEAQSGEIERMDELLRIWGVVDDQEDDHE